MTDHEPRAARRQTVEAIGIGGGLIALLMPVVGWLAFGASLVVGRLRVHQDVSLGMGVLTWLTCGGLALAGAVTGAIAGIIGLRQGPPRARSALALVLVAAAALVWLGLWGAIAWKVSHAHLRY